MTDLGAAAAAGALGLRIAQPVPLEQIAEAHDRVDAGTRERIVLRIS